MVCSGLLLAVFLSPGISWAEDWPQWRGPNRDGVWRESGIVDNIPASGLLIRWRARIGQGYSGPVVADGKVFVTDRRSNPDVERVLCFEEATGKPVWQHVYSCEYAEMEYGNGPRASPTVDQGKVYTLGTKGHLYCLNTANGEVIWQKDLVKDFNALMPRYGVSAAPLVEDDLLIVCAGGQPEATVIAFDKLSGAVKWRAVKDRPAYSAPMAITRGGTRQLIMWTAEHVWSLDPKTGQAYWKVPYKCNFDDAQVVASPVLQGDRLLCMAGWGRGSFMLQLDTMKPAVSEVWRTRKAPSTMTATPTFHNEKYFYNMLNDGKFACLDAATGEEVWTTNEVGGQRHGTAHITRNGEKFFLFNQRGQLILANLSAAGYRELGRCLLVEPTAGYRPQAPVTWAHPAYANRNIYVRNDKELVCASLAAEDVSNEIPEPGLEADLKFTKAFGAEDPILSLAISPDGKWLAGGTWRGAVKLLDWQSASASPPPMKHKRTVTALDFSPDGKLLASAGGNAFYSGGNNYKKNAEVRLWDCVNNTGLGALEGHTDKVLATAFSPKGNLLASGGMDQTVRLWDVAAKQPSAVLPGHQGAVSSVAFSPDGNILASASFDGTIRFWEGTAGIKSGEIDVGEEEIFCLAFSPDGRQLATGGADWKVHLWDPNSKQRSAVMTGHRGTVYCLAYSPDGKKLATGSGDETAKIWDVSTGKELMTLRGHESGITSLVFAADGKSLVTTGRDDGVKLWNLSGLE